MLRILEDYLADLKKPNSKRAGKIIFLLAFLIRFGILVVDQERTFKPLTAEASNIAKSLVTQRAFANPYGYQSGPTAHVAPVYPLIIASMYAIADDYRLGSFLVRLISVAGASLAYASLPYFGMAIGFPWSTCLKGAMIGALLPYSRWEKEGFFENHFVMGMFLATCVIMCSATEGGQIRLPKAILAAFLFGIVLLTSPAYVFAICVILIWQSSRLLDSARPMFLATCCIAISLTVSPWLVRNFTIFGKFVPIRSNFWLEFAISNRDEARPSLEDSMKAEVFREAHPSGSLEEQRLLTALGEGNYMELKKINSLAWVKRNPNKFLALCGKRMFNYVFFRHPQWKWLTAYFYLHAALTLAGLLLLWQQKAMRGQAMLYGCLLISFAIVHVAIQVSYRYRYPFHVLGWIPVGCVIDLLTEKLKRGSTEVVPWRREARTGWE